MAFSYNVYTGDGTTTQFAVPFGYVRREHVLATVAGSPATFTWINDSLIQMDVVPANGATVRVYRQTPLTNPLVDFTDGSTLVAADLDTNARQSIYTQQELDDSLVDGLAGVIPNGDKGDITTSVNGSVWTIDNDAVTAAKIASDAVTTAKILNANVTTAKIANDAITTAKILDGNVTTAKIADDAITSAKILSGNVTNEKIADGAITSAKILDGTVAPSDLSTGRPSWDASGNLTAGGDITAGSVIRSNNANPAGHSALVGSIVAVQASGNRHLWFYNGGGGSEGLVFSEAATGNMYVRSEAGGDLIVHRNSDLGVSALYWRTSNTGGRIRMTTGNLVNFHWNNGFYYNIDNNAYVLINASASDANLKDVKQQGVPNALDLVMSLNPVRFAYKEGCPIHVSAEDRYGFIAQELQEVIPELIQEAGLPKRIPESPDEEVEDPGTYLRYADDASKQLIAVLTAALQEAVGRIESLEARLAALEVRLD